MKTMLRGQGDRGGREAGRQLVGTASGYRARCRLRQWRDQWSRDSRSESLSQVVRMTDSVTSDASHFELASRVIDAVVPGYRHVSVTPARAEFTNPVQALDALSVDA